MLDNTNLKESTLRAIRTFLQNVGAAAAAVILVAIPPVEDAVNSVLQLIDSNLTLPPGMVAAIGLAGAAVSAVVAKIMNVVEGRDIPASPEEIAEWIQELTALVEEAKARGVDVVETLPPLAVEPKTEK